MHLFSLVAVVKRAVQAVAAPEPKVKFTVPEVRPPVRLVEMKPAAPRRLDDDWFVLLDVSARAPGITCVALTARL